MNCEKCGKEHDGSFGSGRFCSSYCARSFATQVNKDARRLAQSIAAKNSLKVKAIAEARRGKTLDEQYGPEVHKKLKETYLLKQKNKYGQNYPFEYGSFSGAAREQLLKELNCCRRCGISSWNGDSINLELHHIDGDSQNNKKDNLTLLCPNCHSQTENFRSKNHNKKKRVKIAENILVSALKESKLNIRQALLKVGLAAKGQNYERCKMLITKYQLDMEL